MELTTAASIILLSFSEGAGIAEGQIDINEEKIVLETLSTYEQKLDIQLGELKKEIRLSILQDSTLTTEEKVRRYFSDAPVLAEVSYCESRFRQFNPDGTILRGRANRSDVGVMQINTYYHGAKAQKLGLDLYTLEGNLEYARYLYETQGVAPWIHSSKCWDSSNFFALR